MYTTNNINIINFKSITPFYYPRGKDVDRAEILAREAEWRQIIDAKEQDEADCEEEVIHSYYGEPLSDEELEDKLREADYISGQIKMGILQSGASELNTEVLETPIPSPYKTTPIEPEKTRKLDIRG